MNKRQRKDFVDLARVRNHLSCAARMHPRDILNEQSVKAHKYVDITRENAINQWIALERNMPAPLLLSNFPEATVH